MHDELALYALGALDDPRPFEVHLETCEQCRAELAELRGTRDALDTVPRPQAPATLRARTLEAIRAADVEESPAFERPTMERPAENVVSIDQARLRRARIVSIVSVAALAVVAAGLGYRSFSGDGFSADRTILLSAVNGGAARGEARIDDTAAGQAVELVVSGLPDAPPGMYYECWWVGPNDADDIQDRVSAGTFREGEGTYRMQSSADPARFAKMGVTLEPDDGNPARTGEKVLVSQPPPGTAPTSSTPPSAASASPASAGASPTTTAPATTVPTRTP